MSETKKPSRPEDEYFAKEEAEKLRRLAIEANRKMEAEAREAQRLAHWMRCPKCGSEMGTTMIRTVEVDRCFACEYTGFDAGELEKVVEAEGGEVTRSILRLFKGK